MDALDVAILRKVIQEDAASPLSSNPMRSLRSIARDLEVDKETVRQRLKRLREQVFWPSIVMVNPALAGLKATHVWMDGISLDSRQGVLSRLHERPSVVLINDYVGNTLYVLELNREEMTSEEIIEEIAEIPGVQSVFGEEFWFPPSDLELGSLDWRIVRGLQEEPGTSLADLAERVGLSTRTVRRRLERMIERRALFVVPRFNLEALAGSIADLAVFYNVGASKSATDREALSKLADSVIRVDIHNQGFSFFNLIMDNVARARSILSWVETRPEVRSARLDFVQDRIERVEHMYRLYAERLEFREGGR